MSRPGPIHLCFYSNRCKWSKEFIIALKETPYWNDFKMICVDPSPSRPSLPSFLKQTPTLVITNEQGKQEIRTDNEVLNWIYEQNIKNKGNSTVNEEQVSFMDINLGNQLGDQYSFIDDTMESSQMDMMHNFTFLNGRESNGSREGGGMTPQAVRKVSKKEELLNSQLDQYKAARDVGMPPPLMRKF